MMQRGLQEVWFSCLSFTGEEMSALFPNDISNSEYSEHYVLGTPRV